MNRIFEPLRLAVGSHKKGSGKGCAMNVVSYMNGDTTIVDYPACSDPYLSKLCQMINDTICQELDRGLLCPECSMKVLEIGHRTIGTAGVASKSDYVKLARQAIKTAGTTEVAHQVAWVTKNAVHNAAHYAAHYAAIYAAEASFAAARIIETTAAGYVEVMQQFFDEWFVITGHTPEPFEPERSEQALNEMLKTAA